MTRNLWDGKIGQWRVWVSQFIDAAVVTATTWEPRYMIWQTEMVEPSPVRVRAWVDGLELAR